MVRKLARSIREYKRASLLTPVFVILEVLMEILIPMIMAVLIDEGIAQKNLEVLAKGGILLISCGLSGIIFGILSGNFCAAASAGFAKNLRKDMYGRIQEYSFSNIDKFSVSSIVTRLTTDVTNVQNAYMMIIRVAVRAPVMLAFSLTASCLISARLSLVFLAAVPVLGAGLYLIVRRSHPHFEKVFHIYDELNGVVQENTAGIRVVKSFVREKFEVEKFSRVSRRIYDTFTTAEGIVAYNMPFMQFAVYGCLLFLCWFGAKIIIMTNGTAMTTGELSSLIAYTMNILNCLMMLSQVFVMINMARASSERIMEILEEESSLKNGARPVYEVANGEIVFENVGFGYAGDIEKECLSGISFRVPSGSSLGIIGATGSGKTSLIQLIPRLYDVTEGSVFVGGRNVKDYDLFALRNNVAVVLQKNELFSGTIRENLLWGNEQAEEKDIIRACRLAQADSFVNAFPDGYDTYVEQGGANLSGGQKQRLCIARALLKKPKILILDDSTSAVDTKTDQMIQKAFQEEIPDITKIIISQRVSSVKDADCILVLENGKISGCGTHEELAKNHRIYREIYRSQRKGGEE